MPERCIKRGRGITVTSAFLIGFSILAARLYYLQVVAAEEISSESINSRKRVIELPAKRGEIFDRNGNLLAGTRSMVEVGVDPLSFQVEDESKLAVLAGILNQPYEELKAKVTRRYRVNESGEQRAIRWVPLAKVPEDIFMAVDQLDVSGVYGNRYYERYYAGNETAAHLIGFVNHESTPVMGLERAYQFYLEGQDGWIEGWVDGRRRELAAFREREVAPTAGYDIVSTIDLYLQTLLEREIKELVEKYDPAGVSAIISDPKTGEILALANYPTFNPNEFNRYPMENLRNRAVTDVYEPGSTFKIVPVAGALEQRKIHPNTELDCSIPVVEYQGRKVRLPSDHKELGEIPVAEIVAKSSNRGAAMIGMMLGDKGMYDWTRRFGFGEKGLWPLEGEVSGILHEVKDWDGLTISRLPTGYAIGATPFQVHNAMSIVASGGVFRSPKLLKEVKKENGETVMAINPDEGETVLSRETAYLLSEMLAGVVRAGGTAQRAQLPGYDVAGKTGTSRKIINGVYSERNHYASFSGFFPASDPRVVMTIMVDDAKLPGPAYGGVVAAPVFKEVGEKIISHLAIKKPEKLETLYVFKD